MQVVGVQRRSDTTTCPRQCRSVTRPDRHRSGRAGSSATRPRDDWTGISAISAGKPPPMSTFSRSWRVVRGDHREQHVRPGQAQHQPFGFLRRAQVGRRPSQHREPERHLAPRSRRCPASAAGPPLFAGGCTIGRSNEVAYFRIFCCFHGRFGSAGHRPPRVSMAMAMKASGVWNPLARLVSARRCVFVASESALDRP